MRLRSNRFYSSHHRFVFVGLVALSLSVTAFGQTTPADFVDSGNVKYRRGDLDGAIADYTHAIELDPKFARAYENRGVAKGAKRDPDGAIADLTRASDLDPKGVGIYYNRGIARKAKGDYDGAIADYTRA